MLYRYTKNSRYNPKKQPGAQRREPRLKSRKIQSGPQTDFRFPPTFRYFATFTVLEVGAECDSASIRRAAPAAHRAKRLGFSTRWDTGGWRAQKMRLNTCIHTKLNDSHTRNAQHGTLETQRRSRLGCTLANSAASTHGDAMRKATSRDFHFAPLVESGCDLG